LPACLRHVCHLNPGDRVLVTAAPRTGVLTIYTTALLESILLDHAVTVGDAST
jgi:hypothetical protein